MFLNYFYQVGSITTDILIQLIPRILIILLGFIVPLFILTVTFLKGALEMSEEEKETTEKANKKDTELELQKLYEKIKLAKKDDKKYKQKLQNLIKKEEFKQNKVKEIEGRYRSMTLKGSVLYPTLMFCFSYLFLLFALNLTDWKYLFLASGFLCFVKGLRLVVMTLLAIEYFIPKVEEEKRVSFKKDLGEAFDNFKRKNNGIKKEDVEEAFRNVKNEDKPKPYIKFDENPPLFLKSNSETDLKFRVLLKEPGGDVLKSVEVWFFVSPEITISSGNFPIQFQQKETWSIPKANTIKYPFLEVRRGISCEGLFKLKTSVSGKFKLRYKVEGEGYSEFATSDKEIDVVVEE